MSCFIDVSMCEYLPSQMVRRMARSAYGGHPPFAAKNCRMNGVDNYPAAMETAPLRSTPKDRLGIELSLLRVVVGYRVFGAVWLGVLAVVTVAGGDEVDRPAVVVATAVLAAVWTGLVVWLSFRRSSWLRSPVFLAGDVVVAVMALIGADLAGSGSFAGGYPLASVFHGVYARGWIGGAVPAVVLSGVAIWRNVVDDVTDLTTGSGAVIVYGFAAAAASWTVAEIRSRDAMRVGAEAALAFERDERARAEERAAMASRIHDSVLQTLALIQRDKDDPPRVAALARRQERELRRTLFGIPDQTGTGFRDSLTTVCAEVEDLSGIRIDTVMVGDAPWGPEVEATVLAAREAMLNAVRHAGVGEISVYGQAGAGAITVFVRDRGSGFDMGSAEPGHRGIAESILGRLQSVGGVADITSTPGAGTEVRLEVAAP